MQHPSTPLPELLRAIERYFDCELSDSQEESLRKEIAATSYEHPTIDEARAVMGLRRPSRLVTARKRQFAYSRTLARLGAAASVALLIAAGAFLLRPSQSSTCVAYINGQRITDEDAVFACLKENALEFSQGADLAMLAAIDEFESMAPIMDMYESDSNPLDI